jgi:hypothetical protein
MFRFKSNCSVIEVEPSVLDEVISFTPAMWPSCRSSGAATDDAMISGLAPGSDAPTLMVGKIHLRQGRHGQLQVSDGPRQGNGRGQQRRAHGPANEGRGNVHEVWGAMPA